MSLNLRRQKDEWETQPLLPSSVIPDGFGPQTHDLTHGSIWVSGVRFRYKVCSLGRINQIVVEPIGGIGS